MLGKTSVFMMVLLVVAASLIGISSIYLYVEGQGPPAATPQPKQQTQKTKYVVGNVMRVDIYTSSDGKACIADVQLLSNRTNELGIRPGSNIELVAPDESICILFGQSQIGKKIVRQLSCREWYRYSCKKILIISNKENIPTSIFKLGAMLLPLI